MRVWLPRQLFYARVFFLYVYIISVSLKDLTIISVVITVDVKVYTEAMLINTIYLYLIFRLRFLSPFSLAYSYFSRQVMNNSRSSSPPLDRISVHLRRMPRNTFFFFHSRHRGFDFTRACVRVSVRRGTCRIWKSIAHVKTAPSDFVYPRFCDPTIP